MKKLLLTILIIIMSCVYGYAQDEKPPIVTFPYDVEVTTMWFPDDGTFGAGASMTLMRLNIPKIQQINMDLDAVVAKEISGEEATLAGVGLSVGMTDVIKTLGGTTNLAVLPNIGVSVLIDYKNLDIKDIDKYRWAVYGTLLSIKW